MIVGLSGYARSGKDEAAAGLVATGWEQRRFATVLRQFMYNLNPIVGIDEDNDFWRFREVIDIYGWDGYKETRWNDEMRGLMQRVGTDCGRELISDTVWIDATIGDYGVTDYHTKKIVVSDVRFPNEFDAIQNAGGMMIRIHRPGVTAPNDHISEHALDSYSGFYDVDIINDGSINALHDKIRSAVALYF